VPCVESAKIEGVAEQESIAFWMRSYGRVGNCCCGSKKNHECVIVISNQTLLFPFRLGGKNYDPEDQDIGEIRRGMVIVRVSPLNSARTCDRSAS